MENENKLNELIASLQSKIENIAASVNSMEAERVSKKKAEEAAAAQEEHETQLKAAWEEEFKKKYGITAEAPIANNAGSEPAPEPNTPSAETANPTKPATPVGLTPTVKVQENTPAYKTVDEIIAEQRAKRNKW